MSKLFYFTVTIPLFFVLPLCSLWGQELNEEELARASVKQKIVLYNQAADQIVAKIDTISQINYYAQQALDLLKRSPDAEQRAQAYYHLGRVHLTLKRTEPALTYIQKALSLTYDKELKYKSLNILFQIYLEQQDYTKALDNISQREHLAKSKNSIQFKREQIRVLTLQKRYKQAEAMAQEVLNLCTEDNLSQKIWALFVLAEINMARNTPLQAISLLEQAVSYAEVLQISFYTSKACYNLAKALQATQDFQKAIFYAQKALLANKNDDIHRLDSEIYSLLAKLFETTHQTQQAITMLQLYYQSELDILAKRQQLTEAFFDNSIEIEHLENTITTLRVQEKVFITLTVLLFLIILGLLITTMLILSRFKQKSSQLQASLVAYRALRQSLKEKN